MGSSDWIGSRGEAICRLNLTRFHDDAPLFNPVYLGEKWPAVDLLVEVLEPTPKGLRGFFFAQVKTTRAGYQENGRLKVTIPRDKVEALAAYRVPTYLLGVDEPGARVYIVSVQGTLSGMSSLSNAHELTLARLVALRDEVQSFWDGLPLQGWTSRFQEINWKAKP